MTQCGLDLLLGGPVWADLHAARRVEAMASASRWWPVVAAKHGRPCMQQGDLVRGGRAEVIGGGARGGSVCLCWGPFVKGG
jgi:hypothetical protein